MRRPMTLNVEGVAVDPSTIDRLDVEDVDVRITIPTITVSRVEGQVRLRSRLRDGRLNIKFNPVFSISIDIRSQRVDVEEAQRRFMDECGLTQEQAEAVIALIDAETTVNAANTPPIPLSNEPGWQMRNSEGSITPPTDFRRFEVNLPLPNVPVNLDPEIELNNLSISNLEFEQHTTLSSDDINLQGTGVDDFDVAVANASGLDIDQAEVLNARFQPRAIPEFAVTNIGTDLTLNGLHSDEIPFHYSAQQGESDVAVQVVDWHPRWGKEFSFRVLWKRVTIKIETGLDLEIRIFYKWFLDVLEITGRLVDLAVAPIRVILRIGRIALTTIQLGALRVARLFLS